MLYNISVSIRIMRHFKDILLWVDLHVWLIGRFNGNIARSNVANRSKNDASIQGQIGLNNRAINKTNRKRQIVSK